MSLRYKSYPNLFNPTLFSLQCSNRIKRGEVPHLCSETQDPIWTKRSILHCDCPGDLCLVKVGIFDNLAVDMLLDTTFIAFFIFKIFPVEFRFVPWHSHPIAIISAKQRDQRFHVSTSHVAVAMPLCKISCNNYSNAHITRIAQQTLHKLHSKHSDLEMTSASDINTTEHKIFERIRHLMPYSHDLIDVLPSFLLHILIASFFAKGIDRPKHIEVAYATEPFSSAMTASSDLLR